MGYRVLLIAVSGKSRDLIHAEYGVEPSRRFEEFPESAVTGVKLPSDSYLLFINDEITPDDRIFARLSTDASLICCYANETVMNSFAAFWANGQEQWSVFHDAQQGLEHLEITGCPPQEYVSIREQMEAEQTGVDDTDFMFEIPVELFATLGGIRYDQEISTDSSSPWQILTRK